MRKLLIPLFLASVCMMIAFASGCGGGDSNPKIQDKQPSEIQKKSAGGVGAKPKGE
jgi:hypothetical protein